jgi:hypothetical protein
MKQLEALNISAISGLTCPNLYSNVMMLRFTSNGKLCITKGPTQINCICIDQFYIPINSWNSVVTILNPGEIKKIETGLISDNGIRREIQRFSLPSYASNVTLVLDISCIARSVQSSVTCDSGLTFDDFIANLKAAINSDDSIKNEIEILDVNAGALAFSIHTI